MALLVDEFGWRQTLVITACVIFVVGLPLALVLRTNPQRYGLLPDGEEGTSTAAGPSAADVVAMDERGMEVGEALRTLSFYLVTFAFYVELVLLGRTPSAAH